MQAVKLLLQNLPVLNWEFQLTQVGLYGGRRTVVLDDQAVFVFFRAFTSLFGDRKGTWPVKTCVIYAKGSISELMED